MTLLQTPVFRTSELGHRPLQRCWKRNTPALRNRRLGSRPGSGDVSSVWVLVYSWSFKGALLNACKAFSQLYSLNSFIHICIFPGVQFGCCVWRLIRERDIFCDIERERSLALTWPSWYGLKAVSVSPQPHCWQIASWSLFPSQVSLLCYLLPCLLQGHLSWISLKWDSDLCWK